MEFKQWGFTPESYYYSWYKKRINMGLFHITVKVPGLGVHDKGPAGMFGGDNYVNERWRQMAGLRTTATASHSVESGNAGKEDGHWNDVFKQDLLTIADRNVEVSYTMTKEKREKLLDDVMNNILVLERNNEDVSPFSWNAEELLAMWKTYTKPAWTTRKSLWPINVRTNRWNNWPHRQTVWQKYLNSTELSDRNSTMRTRKEEQNDTTGRNIGTRFHQRAYD